jgi:xylulose-5-phosphate/fructose-6-phosphate phosphoketolase
VTPRRNSRDPTYGPWRACGIPSHDSVTTPGSIHEGGELGYVLVHAFGAVFDNPDLIAVAVVGDGEAETGPLAGSWKSVKFLNPVSDGAVLPVLHLNCYKISGPTVLGRDRDEDVQKLLEANGYEVHWVEGVDPLPMHQAFATTLDICYAKIRTIQTQAREEGFSKRPIWPVVVLRSLKGWTGPKFVDGLPVEGTSAPIRCRCPMCGKILTTSRCWNSGCGKRIVDVDLPDFRSYSLPIAKPATERHESTRQLGKMMRDMFKGIARPKNFRLFCPDETNWNRLGNVFEVENRCSVGKIIPIHKSIAAMLGARREGITEEGGKLQAAELIAYRRARIQILDEAGLKKKSCECYRFIRRQFDGLLKEVPAFLSRKPRISGYRAR